MDLIPFLQDYASLLNEAGAAELDVAICRSSFELQLIEAVHVSHVVNTRLSQEKRHQVLELALKAATLGETEANSGSDVTYLCPLFAEGTCLICDQRPLRCRQVEDMEQRNLFDATAAKLSRDIFLALTGSFPPQGTLYFSIANTVSGRFVQQYFQVMRDASGV